VALDSARDSFDFINTSATTSSFPFELDINVVSAALAAAAADASLNCTRRLLLHGLVSDDASEEAEADEDDMDPLIALSFASDAFATAGADDVVTTGVEETLPAPGLPEPGRADSGLAGRVGLLVSPPLSSVVFTVEFEDDAVVGGDTGVDIVVASSWIDFADDDDDDEEEEEVGREPPALSGRPEPGRRPFALSGRRRRAEVGRLELPPLPPPTTTADIDEDESIANELD